MVAALAAEECTGQRGFYGLVSPRELFKCIKTHPPDWVILDNCT